MAEALRNGHAVWGVSRSSEAKSVFLPYRWPLNGKSPALATAENFQFQAIDLNSQLNDLLDLIERVQPELVVNFAAQGMVAESWKTQHIGTAPTSSPRWLYMMHCARKPFLHKYVHVTTPEVYGSTDGGWIKEHNHFAPSTPYAVSRAACDLHLQSFYEAYGFPGGIHTSRQRLWTRAALSHHSPHLLSARTGESMELHGGGHSVRAFIHIKDVVRATLQLAIEGEPGSTWHLSTQESYTIRELVEKYAKYVAPILNWCRAARNG